MRSLNREMLDVIIAVQRLKDFIIADTAFRADAGRPRRDWFAETETYFSEIPDAVMRAAGLHKNRNDLEEALRFEVTPTMLQTEFSKLGQFSFPNDPRGEFKAPE